ncbi:MAG TPA: sugar phosphate isomerase/epimerase [Gemmatimonadales bacterium]|nr:sugar phosphate isomerase/epimerase [Gemmatimonadales bacterium]
MNHPGKDLLHEIEWMAAMGLGFIDLTLEPPMAASWKVDRKAVRNALERQRLGAVGHTAYYLPLASGIEEIRRASLEELRRCVDAFADIGVRWMNVHPDRHAPMHDRTFFVERNIATLEELLPYAAARGVGVMVENLPGDFNTAKDLGELLDPLPDLGLHLDIGHANLMVLHSTVEELLEKYGSRLRHVHLHDNKGGAADLHLPLGTGSVDVRGAVRQLKRAGYDGTITLEVFTPDRHHLAYSRDLLEQIWQEERV